MNYELNNLLSIWILRRKNFSDAFRVQKYDHGRDHEHHDRDYDRDHDRGRGVMELWPP